MGKVFSVIERQGQRIFVQERAEKIISKSKPEVHPMYPTEQRVLDRIKADHPELQEQITKRRPELESNVGRLKISSQTEYSGGESAAKRLEAGNRHVSDRFPVRTDVIDPYEQLPSDTQLGVYEPTANKVPPGRLLFSKAVELLQKLQEKPEDCEKLATECGLSVNDAQNLTKFIRPFSTMSEAKWVSQEQFDRLLGKEELSTEDLQNIHLYHTELADKVAESERLHEAMLRERDQILLENEQKLLNVEEKRLKGELPPLLEKSSSTGKR